MVCTHRTHLSEPATHASDNCHSFQHSAGNVYHYTRLDTVKYVEINMALAFLTFRHPSKSTNSMTDTYISLLSRLDPPSALMPCPCIVIYAAHSGQLEIFLLVLAEDGLRIPPEVGLTTLFGSTRYSRSTITRTVRKTSRLSTCNFHGTLCCCGHPGQSIRDDPIHQLSPTGVLIARVGEVAIPAED